MVRTVNTLTVHAKISGRRSRFARKWDCQRLRASWYSASIVDRRSDRPGIRQPAEPSLPIHHVDGREGETLMRSTSTIAVRRQHQRGFAMTYYGIAMVALVAFVVVGIDVGRLAFT